MGGNRLLALLAGVLLVVVATPCAEPGPAPPNLLSGRLIDAEGRALPGVEVRIALAHSLNMRPGDYPVGEPFTVRTAEDGTWSTAPDARANRAYVTPAPVPGHAVCEARLIHRDWPGFARAELLGGDPGLTLTYEAEAGWPSVTQRLRRGAEVTGVVVAPDGVDPTEVVVTARWEEPWKHQALNSSWATLDGQFRITVPAGAKGLSLRATHHPSGDRGPDGVAVEPPWLVMGHLLRQVPLLTWRVFEAGKTTSRSVSVASAWWEGAGGLPTSVVLRLEPSHPLRLVAKRSDGSPDEVDWVSAWQGGKEIAGLWSGKERGGPEVAVLGLPAGAYTIVASTASGIARASVTVPRAGPVPLRARTRGTLSGRIEERGEAAGWHAEWVPDPGAPVGVAGEAVQVEDDGTFGLEIEEGVAGTLWVWSHASDTAACMQRVAAGPDVVRVVPQRALPISGRVEGVVPAWDTRLEVVAERAGQRRAASVDDDGTFRIRGLAAGAWRLSLALIPYGPAHDLGTSDAGRTDLVFAIPPGVSTCVVRPAPAHGPGATAR